MTLFTLNYDSVAWCIELQWKLYCLSIRLFRTVRCANQRGTNFGLRLLSFGTELRDHYYMEPFLKF